MHRENRRQTPTPMSFGKEAFTLRSRDCARDTHGHRTRHRSLFTYAISANSKADDRELAMAIAQKRMEWLRTIPFTTQTRGVAYSYPNGGLAATATAGVTETDKCRRRYMVNTIISDLNFVPAETRRGRADSEAQGLSYSCGSEQRFETLSPCTTQRSTQVVQVPIKPLKLVRTL